MRPATFSLRSWLGVVINTAIAVPAGGRLAAGGEFFWPFDLFVAVVCGAFAVYCLVVRLELDERGLRRRPGWLAVPWTDIERFDPDPRRELVRNIRLVRRHGRKTSLNAYPMKAERGALLLDEVEKRLSASRSG